MKLILGLKMQTWHQCESFGTTFCLLPMGSARCSSVRTEDSQRCPFRIMNSPWILTALSYGFPHLIGYTLFKLLLLWSLLFCFYRISFIWNNSCKTTSRLISFSVFRIYQDFKFARVIVFPVMLVMAVLI